MERGGIGRHRGVLAAATAIVAALVVGGVGVAGAAQQATDATVAADDGTVWHPDTVAIDVGDTVTWTFANPTQFHNVASDSANWTLDSPVAQNHPDVSYTFDAPGTYRFVCEVHPGMSGTVTVGTPTEEPTEVPTEEPTQEPTVVPQPGGGDDHTSTPAPGGTVTDTAKPRVSKVRLKGLRRAVRVRFRLSENAGVTIRVKRGRRTVKSKRVQAPAGTRTVKLRSRRLRRGRYTARIQARDAFGNTSSWTKKRVRLRR
jgi:plastocyanin